MSSESEFFDREMRHGYVIFLAGCAYTAWRLGEFSWLAALIMWAITSVIGLLVLTGLSWLARKRDAWLASRRSPTHER